MDCNKIDYSRLKEESDKQYKVRMCKLRDEFVNPSSNRLKVGYEALEWNKIINKINVNLDSPYDLGRRGKSDRGEDLRQFYKEWKKGKGNKDANKKVDLKSVKVSSSKGGAEQTSNIDGIEVSSLEELKDNDRLLEIHNYPKGLWRVDSAQSSQWNAQTKDGVKTFYSSKIKVSKRKDVYYDYANITKFFKDYKPKPYKENLSNFESKKVLLIEPADLHIGKTEFVTLERQEERVKQAIGEIINRARLIYEIEKVILIMGNDWLNADSVIPQSNVQRTQKGTILSARNGYDEIFEAGLRVGLFAIEEILKINNKCNVEVIYLPANHDRISSFGLCHSLNQRFYGNPRVNFDLSFKKVRKYRKIGNFGVGFTHGEKPRNQIEFGRLFALEAPEIFVSVKYREVHSAHYHSEAVKEDKGVLIRRISSPSPEDSWLVENGYVGAQPKIQSFIIGSKYGIEDTFNSYVEYNDV